jgi:thioester reductase-like protein
MSVLCPGNMAGSSVTGVQNPNDLNYLLFQGMIAAKCAPTFDTNYALDLTPVDLAARAVVHLVVHAPQKAMGQHFHLQSPQTPVALAQVAEWLCGMGYAMEGVTRDEWIKRIEDNENSRVVSHPLKNTLKHQPDSNLVPTVCNKPVGTS